MTLWHTLYEAGVLMNALQQKWPFPYEEDSSCATSHCLTLRLASDTHVIICMWTACHHGMSRPRVASGRDGLHIYHCTYCVTSIGRPKRGGYSALVVIWGKKTSQSKARGFWKELIHLHPLLYLTMLNNFETLGSNLIKGDTRTDREEVKYEVQICLLGCTAV
jgi:hypothetical protein